MTCSKINIPLSRPTVGSEINVQLSMTSLNWDDHLGKSPCGKIYPHDGWATTFFRPKLMVIFFLIKPYQSHKLRYRGIGFSTNIICTAVLQFFYKMAGFVRRVFIFVKLVHTA